MSLYGDSSSYAKFTYLPGYNNQLENAKGTLLGLLGKSAMDAFTIEGKQPKIKLRTGDSLGQGTIAEGGDFPTPGDATTEEASLTTAHLSHSIRWTSEEMVHLDSMSAAAAPIMREKMTWAQEAMQRDIQRQAWGDGTGVLANIASSSGNDLTLDATTTSQIDRDRYIWVDDADRMLYDIVHGTTGADQETGFTVTNIVESTNTLTGSQDLSSATSAGVLVRAGDWASGGAFRSLEFAGIKAMIDDDNTYLGINRASAGNGFWKAIVVDNGGTLRPLTENLVHTLTARMARRRTDGKNPRGNDYAAFANSGTYYAYHNLLSPGIRYTLGETPDIGWPAPINMDGIPLYLDIHAPKNGIVVIHKPSVGFVKPKHQGNLNGSLTKFLERGGSIFFQGNAASGQGHSAQVFSYLEGFLGMASTRPRNHGWLRDIIDPVTV